MLGRPWGCGTGDNTCFNSFFNIQWLKHLVHSIRNKNYLSRKLRQNKYISFVHYRGLYLWNFVPALSTQSIECFNLLPAQLGPSLWAAKNSCRSYSLRALARALVEPSSYSNLKRTIITLPKICSNDSFLKFDICGWWATSYKTVSELVSPGSSKMSSYIFMEVCHVDNNNKQ